MRQQAFDGIKQGLQEFLQASHPKLDVSLFAFGSGTKMLVGFGTDNAQQLASAQQIQLEGPDSKTALYEAIAGAILQLNNLQAPGSKRIIVISDGEDEGSAINLEKVVRNAAAGGIAIDAISTGPSAARGLAALRTLSTGTQGRLEQVPTGMSVGPALEGLIDRAREAGKFQVSFKYDSAPGTIDGATVTLIQTGAQPASQTIQGSFARVNVKTVKPVEPPVQPEPVPPDGPKWWEWLADIKILIGLSIAVLGALLLWFVFHRNGKPIPIPLAPSPDAPIVLPPTRPARGRSTVIVEYTFPPPQPGAPSAVLKGYSGPIGTLVVPIEKPLFRIGAGEKNDLRLANDDFVSNDHEHSVRQRQPVPGGPGIT